MKKIDFLSHDQEKELLDQRCPKAVEKLVMHFIPLVKRLVAQARPRGQDREDLLSAGCIGLMIAIKKFQPSFGVRFSSYARPWIFFAIQKGQRCGASWISLDELEREQDVYEDVLEKEVLKARLQEAVKNLAIKEQKVLENRFFRDPPLSRQAVASALACCPEAVRKIEKKALEKIRKNVFVRPPTLFFSAIGLTEKG